MKQDIINLDENGSKHDVQIDYYTNGNIYWIRNFHHGKWYGYIAWFNLDKSIGYKSYFNMDKLIYIEDHKWNNQIQIMI